jgi:hypothetical protein
MKMKQALCCAVAATLVAASAPAEELTTVRFGEQESCRVTGVTTYQAKDGRSTIRFDVSKLGKDADVKRATFCFWVSCASTHDRAYRTWGFRRWTEDAAFDGFKIFAGAQPSRKPLDVKFPFHSSVPFRFEFDVTPAAREWARNPDANQGLAMNFTLPVPPADDDPLKQWLKPYLQVTRLGANPTRPEQVDGLNAFCRSGQVFLTWKQKQSPVAFFDQTVRVYRHDQPITAGNLDQAECLGEVHRNSQLNYRRGQMCIGWGHTVATDFYAGSLMLDGKLPVQKRTRFGGGKPEGYVKAMPKRFNFVIDHDWAEDHPDKILTHVHADREEWTKARQPTYRVTGGPELSDDTGLFVHTVRKSGRAHFCVTAVVDGNENRRDIGGGNSLAKPVSCKVAEPAPVLQAVYNHAGPWGPVQLREYVYWEGGRGKLHNTPSAPICFTYGLPKGFVSAAGKEAPDRKAVGRKAWLRTSLHLAGYGNNYFQNSPGSGTVRMDTRHIPPTRNAPFPTASVPGVRGWRDGYVRAYHPTRKAPDIPGRDTDGRSRGEWTRYLPSSAPKTVFGYVDTWDTGADPRKATVVPYVENRALFEVDAVLRAFPELDPDRVVASGEWNGMALAVHHADRFAFAACTMEGPWTAERLRGDRALLAGLAAWNLPTVGGHSVWEWNDLVWYSRTFPERQWPFISHLLSVNYDGRGTWSNMGYPDFYLNLQKEMRGGAWWWCDIGDAPATDFTAVARDECYPVLTNATCAQRPVQNWHKEPRGTLNGFIEWHRPGKPFLLPCNMAKVAKPEWKTPPPGRKYAYVIRHYANRPRYWAARSLEIVDEPQRFEMALHIRPEGRILNGQSVPPCPVLCGQVDVTPQRLQKFRVTRGEAYQWKNVRVETGRVLQVGIVQPHELNGRLLLTVPGVCVDQDVMGNKLIVTPAGSAPAAKADPPQKILVRYPDRADRRKIVDLELAFHEYVARCKDPEMVKAATSGRVFTPRDFTNGGPRAGHYSMWGGGWDDAFEFPKTGRYRAEIRTDRAYFQNGAWPIYHFAVAGLHNSAVWVDTPGPKTTFRWFDVPEPGRHRVGLRIVNNTFHEPFKHGDGSGMIDRGVTLVDVRFIHVNKPAGKPFLVRVSPVAAKLGLGVPLKLSAEVLDAAGRPAVANVHWSTSGGALVSADGLFKAVKAGTYTVVAKLGGLSDSAEITVGGRAWQHPFNDQRADGWRIDKSCFVRARWWKLELGSPKGKRTACHAWYAPGAAWDDYVFTAERAGGARGARAASACAVLVRFTDAKNHYRFERTRDGKFRLVKVVAGAEEELAAADAKPPPITLRGDEALEYTMSRWEFVKDDRKHRGEYWNQWEKEHAERIAARDAEFWKRLKDRRQDDLAKEPLKIERWQVEVKGAKITCKVNGKVVLSAEDDAMKSGTVGFFTADGGVAWDNLSVEPQ